MDLPDQIALQKELRNLFDNNPMGVAIMRHEADADGLVTAHRVYTNRAFASLFGASSLDELMNRPVHESWVDVRALANVNHRLKTQQQILNHEAERIRVDGSRFWISMTSQAVEIHDKNLTIIWHTDINDKKMSEINLRESEAKLRDYMDSSVDWVWEMDADLRFTYVSENVERTTGIEPEWHYGKTREDLLGPDYDRTTWGLHLETLNTCEPFRDFVFLRPGHDGEKRWISSSGKPIFSEEGEFQGYRGTSSDVTERIENQELRTANQAKSEFLASMSHELRTPLNAVIGFGQMLEMNWPRNLTADQQEYAQIIVKSGDHLLALISEVLDLAGIEAGHLKLSIEPVNVEALIRDVLTTMGPIASKSGITLSRPMPKSSFGSIRLCFQA
ncbi:MAG: PAS domain S-box protein, partial [Alphaproteobacteria bacterium]